MSVWPAQTAPRELEESVRHSSVIFGAWWRGLGLCFCDIPAETSQVRCTVLSTASRTDHSTSVSWSDVTKPRRSLTKMGIYL